MLCVLNVSSVTSWRAQVVVIKEENDINIKRFCVDYSQNININTELDFLCHALMIG